MPYIFGIAGGPGTGKTRMLERLIPELARRGYRVGSTNLVEPIQADGSLDANRWQEVDLVLAEGSLGATWPKLEVHSGHGPLLCAQDPWLVAVVGPEQPRRCPVPWYHWDEIIHLASVVENSRSLGMSEWMRRRSLKGTGQIVPEG